MFTKDETISLVNLRGGSAVELFDTELEKVLDNILDPNTDPKETREIILRVVFKPDEDRNLGDVNIRARKKLAGSRGFNTRVFIGRGPNGRPEAREWSTGQQSMFSETKDEENENQLKAIEGGKHDT